MYKLSCVVAVAAVFSSAAQADTIHVDIANCPGPGMGTVGDPYCSIQTAIIAAGELDEVVVAPGTYNEAIFFNGDDITIRSSDGPDVTIIDATGMNTSAVKCILGEGRDAVLQGFTVTGGDAERGGGMWIVQSSPTIRNCRFVGNNAIKGGGIYNEQSDPLVIGCTFEANTTSSGGAGMMVELGSAPIIVGCTFEANTASGNGGGMEVASATAIVVGCMFRENTSGNAGGGVLISAGSLFVNCVFYGNIANQGGGVYNVAAVVALINCTVVGNVGAGVWVTVELPVINSVVWGNDGGSFGGPAVPGVSYSNIQGGWPGTGNINADPLFVDLANGDLHLSSGSPCINAGDDAAVPKGTTTDLDGNPRFIGTVDMGAYEFQGEVTVRCCFDDESCQDITELLCTQSGGQSGQPGSSCLDGPCSPPPSPCPADLDGDGNVGITDFLDLLAAWGPCP